MVHLKNVFVKYITTGFVTCLCVSLGSCSQTRTEDDPSDRSASAVKTRRLSDAFSAQQIASFQAAGRYAIDIPEGAVATVNPIATEAAAEVLSAGGNAIDAAVQAAYMLGVVDSHNSGIGGGCFIMVRYQDGRVQAIDGREMAPAAATADMYVINGEYQKQLSRSGSLAIGIPGSVAAYEMLHEAQGSIPISRLIERAASVAEQGFAIDKTFASRLARVYDVLSQNTDNFDREEGGALESGETLVQPELAQTYRQLALHGSDYFYGNLKALDPELISFSQAVAKYSKTHGGIITSQDFNHYQALIREPVTTTLAGYKIFGYPPPSSGGIHVVQALQMLSQKDQRSMSDTQRLHFMIEVLKRIFADRAHHLGDADFVKVSRGLLDREYARSLVESISMDHANESISYGKPSKFDTQYFSRHASLPGLDKHTTHISVIDAKGNMVAITTTLNTPFGSKVVIPGTGVLMNNQMDDFATSQTLKAKDANYFGLVQGAKNQIEPGKRPLSSMSPTLVIDAKTQQPLVSLGAAGGPTIISQVVQVLNAMLFLDKSLEQAMAHPRVHHQWSPARGLIDPFVSSAIKSELKDLGHELRDWPSFGGTTAVGFDADRSASTAETIRFKAVTEPRLIERNKQ